MLWSYISQLLYRRPKKKETVKTESSFKEKRQKVEKQQKIATSRYPQNSDISMSELEGHITKFVMHEKEFEAICFACPKCEDAHWCVIPYHDNKPIMAKKSKDEHTPIWQRDGGDSIENITVRPSFHVTKGCGLHGYVINGKWCWC